ncbi:LysM peptidoglycan-binding domain-containing protein [Treponema brennaborense]|uniref:Uncharacterized protein n=1 Tax=Treponema brennaborense (strain DSM 12168 / CIP 105900 / DD5/3) TaxID=906968 RepID=F4LKI5_TREBD|nr:membrane protein [Treponema brennaborense]AEE17541.1 hypothetical protein Trebr_2126 [Treponema brennaborense DSM 12168]
MKKTVFTVCLLLTGLAVFAASYADNEYQKLARTYYAQAAEAFDSGEYDAAVEYTQKAEENAELSRAYIALMLERSDADTQIKVARNRLVWAKNIRADVNYPMAYTAATRAIEDAQNAFAAEEYATASGAAKRAMESLAGVKEVVPLPKYYVVRPWADTKDCYWNIAGKPYVYDNPFLWENLYQANKNNMENPSDPNLIHPGMKVEIPSISGEYREGTYDPAVKYDSFSVHR